MLGIDLLHAYHLGVGRDLVASAIKVLAKERYWGGQNLEQRLAQASHSLRAFAKQNKKTVVIKRLDKKNLNWTSGE